MLNWLLEDFDVFGLPGQNWMLIFAGSLIIYIAGLAMARRRERRLR